MEFPDHIDVYICPTPGCGNYYGASNMGDLKTARKTGPAIDANPRPDQFFTRDNCPDCRQRTGEQVPRIRLQVAVAIPAPGQ